MIIIIRYYLNKKNQRKTGRICFPLKKGGLFYFSFLIIFSVFNLVGCVSEKFDCYDKLERDSSETNCLGLPIAFRNTTMRSTGLADLILIKCLQYEYGKRKCEKKSDLIPRGVK